MQEAWRLLLLAAVVLGVETGLDRLVLNGAVDIALRVDGRGVGVHASRLLTALLLYELELVEGGRARDSRDGLLFGMGCLFIRDLPRC